MVDDDNPTMTDPNGKVSIYLGSSWLQLSNDIGVYSRLNT
jgi:hypothetical protein